MIYLDTSAILKLYIAEPEFESVRRLAGTASVTCTHLIAYAETRAGLARALRMKRVDAVGLAEVKRDFEQDWRRMLIVTPDETGIRRAGELAERLGLCCYDSVHLAAAERVASQSGNLLFACFDNELNKAANAIGMQTLN